MGKIKTDTDIRISYTRWDVPLSDGGLMSVDWNRDPSTIKDRTKVIIFFPGLAGDSSRGYIKMLSNWFLQHDDYLIGVVHARGVNTELKTDELIKLSMMDDWRTAMDLVTSRLDALKLEHELYGVGFSMGGNVMLRYQALTPESRFKALMAICNPFDVQMSANMMRGTPSEPYLVWLGKKVAIGTKDKEMLEKIRVKYGLDYDAIEKCKDWGQFDKEMLAKTVVSDKPDGVRYFRSIEEYRHESSALLHLSKISVPTFILHAKDDPIVPVCCIPMAACVANPHFIVGLSNYGSHCLYFLNDWFGVPRKRERWICSAIKEWVDINDAKKG